MPYVLFFCLLAGYADASAFYCDNKIVSTGDRKAEVSHNCGEPAWREVRKEEIITRIDEDTERRVFVTIEKWIYNFGPHRLMRMLRFRDGKLSSIETRGYGFTPDTDFETECSDGSRFSTGDSELDIVLKCGVPTSKDVHEEEIREKIDSTTERRVIITVEEWTYNFGPNRLLHILEFRDGELVNIKTKGFGY